MPRRRDPSMATAEKQFMQAEARAHVASVIPDEEIDAEVQAREEQAQEDAKGYEAFEELTSGR